MTRLLSALAATLFLCCSVHAAGKQIRIALQLPKESHLYQNLEYFKGLVETGTHGALEIVIAHSGELIKEQDAPEAVATGVVEMASVTINQYGGVIPAADLFVQPFLFTYPPLLAIATRPGSPVRAAIDQAILKHVGARVLWWQSNGTNIMLSKAAPVAVPAAIAGKNVRVTTESEAELFRLCGSIPRVIPAVAQWGAYEKGEVDAGSTTIAVVPVRKLWEVTRFVTFTRHRTAEFVVTINERLWRSLPDQHKRIIEGAAREAEVKLRAHVAGVEREARAQAEKSGMRIVELTAADIDKWKFCAAPMLEAYLDRSGELGAQVMAGYRKILVDAYRTTPSQVHN